MSALPSGPFLPLLLQLLPILVFLVVDALVQDPLWAIVATLVFVLLQGGLTYLRLRRFDRFLLLDLLLVGGMGAASLLTKNEIFFKLKPAILESVMIPYLLLLALGGDRLLQGYLERYAVGVTPGPAALPLLRRLIFLMATLIALHAGLSVVAALSWSRRTWGFVSGPGFYLILVPLLGWSLLQRRRLRRVAEAPPPTEEPPRRVSARRRTGRRL